VAILSGDAYNGNGKKNFKLEMERMIKEQIFALEMDALTNRLQRLQFNKTDMIVAVRAAARG